MLIFAAFSTAIGHGQLINISLHFI